MTDTGQFMFWSLGDEDIPISPSSLLDLPFLPGKESFSARLKEVVTRLDMLPDLYAAFPVRRPVESWWSWWFGFWMDSPLSKGQCQLLHLVFAELSKKSPLYRERITSFLAALEVGRDTDTLLYVKLAPPGHDDLGWSTTFAHCPHCKAEAPLKRWQDKYPEELIECSICGQLYSPAATYFEQEIGWM